MHSDDRNTYGLKLLQKGLVLHKGLATGRPDPDAAVEWYLRAARIGFLPAMRYLGLVYEEKRDYESAYFWFLEAAMGGEENSLYHVGDYYYRGLYVREDPEKAYRYICRAYQNGVDQACWYMGLYAEKGLAGQKPNPEEAVRFYRKGMRAGVPACAVALGRCLRRGSGTAQNREMGMEYTVLACRWGDTEAWEDLGRIYETGDGAGPDPQKAAAYYTEGAARGSESCRVALERLKKKEAGQDGR